MENLLHSLPDGNSKWRPSGQPLKLDPEDSCPSPEDSSFESSCDSINEENAYINNVSTRGLESTIIQHALYIQKTIRGQQAFSILSNLLALHVFKSRVIFLQMREKTLKKIRLNLAARKITRVFRQFWKQKKEFSAGLLEKYKEHCAIYIQTHYRGYLVRKNFQEYLLCREARVKGLVLGWKTRRVMRNSEVLALKTRTNTDPSLKKELISKVENLIRGEWVVKGRSPTQRSILYKNNTKNLRVQERRLSNQSLDDSVQKEKEYKKQVKFSLKHYESPKINEPDLKAIARKSILRVKSNPFEVDWSTLQEKLDKLYFESEGRPSFEDGIPSLGHSGLLFKHRPRMKKREKRMEMKDWVLEDFELSCEHDQSFQSKYPYLEPTDSIPVLFPESKFFNCLEVNSLYICLKKEYNSLRNSNFP